MKIEYNDIPYDSISALCNELNFPYNVFIARRRKGWSVEKILHTPLRKDLKNIRTHKAINSDNPLSYSPSGRNLITEYKDYLTHIKAILSGWPPELCVSPCSEIVHTAQSMNRTAQEIDNKLNELESYWLTAFEYYLYNGEEELKKQFGEMIAREILTIADYPTGLYKELLDFGYMYRITGAYI